MYEERPQEPKKRYLCKEKGAIANVAYMAAISTNGKS